MYYNNIEQLSIFTNVEPSLDVAIVRAIRLITDICLLTVRNSFLADLRRSLNRAGIVRAVAEHDTSKLLDWLLEVFSYQGVSDAAATRYMSVHGRPSTRAVVEALTARPSCPRLARHLAFQGCGFGKTARTCAEPDHIDRCPLPTHDFRNGRLNQMAYGLTLFVQDVCRGDLVGWIDDRLAANDSVDTSDRSLIMRAAILEPLTRVHGISYKVLSMAMADLLLGAGSGRERWTTAGSGMVAVDTLVHNWLARTGILSDMAADHLYGPGCYRPGGCAAIISACAQQIDASRLCPDGPAVFPRLIQHGIWRFCAESGHGICNGNRIDDQFGCDQQHCPIFQLCDRKAIAAVHYVGH